MMIIMAIHFERYHDRQMLLRQDEELVMRLEWQKDSPGRAAWPWLESGLLWPAATMQSETCCFDQDKNAD